MRNQFHYLFSPLRIGSIVVRNRTLFPAHLTNYAEDNLPSERHAYYYAERAKGGVGLIITEEQSVHPSDHAYEKLIHAFDQRVIPGYRRIAEMVHRHGAKIFAQISHNGQQCSSLYTDCPVWGPSNVPDPLFREMPKTLELEEIQELVAGFAKVATHVKEGGFDGIEIQGSHSSLIRQFFSPFTNKRTDEYGGSLENRMRFCIEVTQAIREKVGRGFVVGIRLSGDELIDGGLTLDDMKEVAARLESTGLLDFINTSIGSFHALFMVEGSMHVPLGYAVFIAADLRKVVDLPVFTSGRINDPIQAERILANGYADMIGMARAQICDPEFANKAREGRLEDIRKCIADNQYCAGRVGLNRSLACMQNPAAGNEQLRGIGTLEAAETPKKVMVVGGGPGGLKSAEIAARRGHQVSLYECEKELGGQVNLLMRGAGRSEFGDLIRNLLYQIQKLPVELKTGIEVTPEMVLAEKAEAVVLATGSKPYLPAIPGSGQENVVHVWSVLGGEVEVGKRVVVVDQVGSHRATSVAELLADQGKEVHILTPHLYVGHHLGPTMDLELWYGRVLSKGVVLNPCVVVLEVAGDRVTILNPYSGEQSSIEGIDTVVFATHGQPNDELYFALKGKVKELYRVGDCVAPRNVGTAILEGELVARKL